MIYHPLEKNHTNNRPRLNCKEGVQAIDDDFFEWFLNNPNCEEVEIKTYATNCSCENN
jgi:hypothetical protein